MTFELPPAKGPVSHFANEVGALIGFSIATTVAAVRVLVRRKLAWRELLDQAWRIASVTSAPALLLMIPIGVLIAVTIGSLAGQLGAEGYTGAVVGFVIVGQASALVCALMLAGVGGSAICADLGSRTIREEVEAMEVLGLNVIERLVVPRVFAAVIVGVALCAMVTAVGVSSCFLFQVVVQNISAGSFLTALSQYTRLSDFVVALVKSMAFAVTSALVASFKGLHAKGGPSGVADAVNEAVVLAFILVFIVNTVLSQLYSVLVVPVGGY